MTEKMCVVGRAVEPHVEPQLNHIPCPDFSQFSESLISGEMVTAWPTEEKS